MLFDLITFVLSFFFATLASVPYGLLWFLIQDFSFYSKFLFWVFAFLTYPIFFLLMVASYKKIRKIGLVPSVFNPKKEPRKIFQIQREIFFHNFALSLFFPYFNHYYGFQKTYYRLMGAKVGKNVVFGRDVMIQDLSLVEIHDGAVLGQSCRIVGHIQTKADEVLLGKVVIGENSVIGGHAKLAPGVTIGKNCVIGVDSILLPGAVIADGTKLPPRSLVRGGGDFL